jgi:hypothetical protein
VGLWEIHCFALGVPIDLFQAAESAEWLTIRCALQNRRQQKKINQKLPYLPCDGLVSRHAPIAFVPLVCGGYYKMSNVSKVKKNSLFTSLMLVAVALITALFLPMAAQAGTAQIVDVEQGATPFIIYAGAFYYSGTIASVGYTIQPISGSVTRPLTTTYSASYLTSHNYFFRGANAVIIPIFGLYAGTSNTINVTYTFTDGTKATYPITFKTPAYTDPCPQVAARTFFGIRPNTASLTYDYFELKDYCSTNSSAILDTDGNIRWVGDGNDTAQDTEFLDNAFFYSNNATGINRMDITNGAVTQLADFASIGVTATNQHNIDPGRNGNLLVEVNTSSELEATILEVNPTTGAVLNTWDMGAIISAAMSAGGETAATISSFVQGTAADWFHNNATTYNPADNTLVVSSRENFVIAVDYDAPSSGQRKIHWILGDTTKAWYNTPKQSLKAYTLTLGANTVPPIGQHAVSIDHQGNVLLFDDGLGGLTFTPGGQTRSYSAARSYQINTSTMTATEIFTYTAQSGGQNLYSPICGSVYDVGGNYLVDFTTNNFQAAATAAANPTSTAATNNAVVGNLLASNNTTAVVLVGVGNSSTIEFVSAIQSPGPCAPGWNALPFASNTFTF